MRDARLRYRTIAWFYGLALGVLLLDQLTKSVARRFLELDRPVNIIPGFFDLRLSFNTGAAFGVLPNWAPLFIIMALVAIYAIVKLGRSGWPSRIPAAGLGLLMGGAAGNLIDRIAWPARGVTDFLSLHIARGGRIYAWPTFNVADIAIVTGAVLLFYHVYMVEKRRADH